MSKKVLIIGADGQLAFDLIRTFKKDYQVIEARHKDFDICDDVACQRFLKNHKPEIVINTAAFHKTLECELNPEKSFRVNAIGAYNVAHASAAIGARTVFFSTDYVFDGIKKTFNENDTPNPLNVYGASKLAGEILTKIANENYYIIRTTGLFGIHRSGKGHNFVLLMLEKAKSGEDIKVVDDQFSALTYTHDLALKIVELIDRHAPAGTYHLVNSGFYSWYQFAKKTFELANVQAKLSPISTLEWPSTIKRPKYGCLISENLKKVDIQPLRPWTEAVTDYLAEIQRA